MNQRRSITIRGSLPLRGAKPALKRRWDYTKAAKQMRSEWAVLARLAMQKTPGAKGIRRCSLTYIVCPTDPVAMKKYYAEWRALNQSNYPDWCKPYAGEDRDNVRASAKPIIDGLVDAGLLQDDTHKVILSDPVEWVEPDGAGYLELRIDYEPCDPFDDRGEG